MPQALQLPLLCLGIHTAAAQAELYTDSVREVIRLGGCSASRAAFVGACAAAMSGMQSIPDEWLDRFGPQRKVEIHQLADILAKL